MNAFTNLSESFKEVYGTLNEEMLAESRLDFLKEQNKTISTDHDTLATHHDAGAIIDHFAEHADPTKNKAHTQYIIGLYKNKSIRQEDAPRIKESLSNFEKYKGKLTPDEKQLTTKNYPSVASIEDKIQPHMGTVVSKKQAEKTLDQPGHELKYEDENIKVYHLHDKEASQNLYGGGHQRGGLGTSWCTAARSENCMFDKYRKDGNLHVVHDKDTGKVFQYHTSSNSFMDAKDEPISTDDFKKIAPSLHKAWKEKPELLD